MKRRILYRELEAGQQDLFLELGYPRKYIFPHRTYCLPKAAPDALRLAKWMVGKEPRVGHFTLLLHATPERLCGLPADLFLNNDLFIHRQQFGRPGHVAFATLAVAGRNLYVLGMVSDLVQRRSRAGKHKDRIRLRFRGWRYMLVNAVLNFAIEFGCENIQFPKAKLVMQYTRKRSAASDAFFERLYDKTLTEYHDVASLGDWWQMNVPANRRSVVKLIEKQETLPRDKTICITHDIERGLGHREFDEAIARRMDQTAPSYLSRMLDAEQRATCRATYCVVGSILEEVRKPIEKSGHCLAFHSYDHESQNKAFWQKLPLRKLRIFVLSRLRGYPPAIQLKLCRQVDYALRGYRPPNSVLTREHAINNLRYFNFDWLASSEDSLGVQEPTFRDGIVFVPILFDDFPLFRGDCSYSQWQARAVSLIEKRAFTAFGLHDCYAEHWLPRYLELLEQVKTMGETKTLEDVANETFLEQCL